MSDEGPHKLQTDEHMELSGKFETALAEPTPLVSKESKSGDHLLPSVAQEFPNDRNPIKLALVPGSETDVTGSLVLLKAGFYCLQAHNRGTGGIMSSKAFFSFGLLPLEWSAGACPIAAKYVSQGLISLTADSEFKRSPTSNLDTPIPTTGVRLDTPTGPFDFMSTTDDMPYEAHPELDGTCLTAPEYGATMFYKDSILGVRSYRGNFFLARNATRMYYFYCASPYQLMAYGLQFGWGRASSTRITLSFVGSFNPILPFYNPVKNAYKPKMRILALDGGGVLGNSTVVILDTIEKELRKQSGNPDLQIRDCFDLIVGTSTGAITASAIYGGLPLSILRSKFKEWAKVIFEGSRTIIGGLFLEGYDVENTKKTLLNGVGHSHMCSFPRPLLCLTATDVAHSPYSLYLLRNFDVLDYDKNTSSYKLNAHPGVTTSASMLPLWLATWIAVSAPTYIKGPTAKELRKMGYAMKDESPIHLVDGAFLANNPSLLALKEAAAFMGVPLKEFIKNHLGALVSIGTGVVHRKKTAADPSSLQILMNAPHLLLEARKTHQEIMHDVLKDIGQTTYFRFNATGFSDVSIDDTDQLDFVKDATVLYLEDEKYYDTIRLARKLLSHQGDSEYIFKNYKPLSPRNVEEDVPKAV